MLERFFVELLTVHMCAGDEFSDRVLPPRFPHGIGAVKGTRLIEGTAEHSQFVNQP